MHWQISVILSLSLSLSRSVSHPFLLFSTEADYDTDANLI